MRTAIIIVNWNGWQDSIECLSSVVGSGALSNVDVWLVDNESSDGSVDYIVQWCQHPLPQGNWRTLPGVHHVDGSESVNCRVWQADGHAAPTLPGVQVNIVKSGRNLGFAGGNNVGIAAAGLDRYSHFWLLNNDTVMAGDALEHLLRRAAAEPVIGMVGSTLVYYADPERVQALGGGWFDKRAMRAGHIGESTRLAAVSSDAATIQAVEAQTAYVIGASMLVTVEFVRDVGPMCEDYFLYFEELDWAFRSASRYRMAYAPLSFVFHKAGASTMQKQSEFSLNLLYRNRVRFTGRFLPASLRTLRRALAWEMVRHLIKGRWMSARLVIRTLRDFRSLSS